MLADAASLILWAAIYTGTGWILSDQMAAAIEWALTYSWAAMVVLILLVLGAFWRRREVQRPSVRDRLLG